MAFKEISAGEETRVSKDSISSITSFKSSECDSSSFSPNIAYSFDLQSLPGWYKSSQWKQRPSARLSKISLLDRVDLVLLGKPVVVLSLGGTFVVAWIRDELVIFFGSGNE